MNAKFYNLSANLSPTIYHYTSPDAFQKIIAGKKLRFSRFDCLNDYSEGTIVKSLFPVCLDNLLEEGTISKAFYDLAKETDVSNKVLVPDKEKFFRDAEADAYICCFSEDPDALQMWQYYSKNGNYEGYNIGVDTKLLRRTKYGVINLYKVEYNEPRQKEYIRDGIVLCSQQFDQNKIYNPVSMSYKLRTMNMCFKKSCFSGEKEVRAVLTFPADPSEDKTITPPSIQYRMGHGLMIPYFDLEINPDSIQRITIGPIMSNNTMGKNKEVVRQFATGALKRPFENIVNSDIPVRY